MVGNGGSPIYVDGPWSHRPVTANGTRFHIAEAGEGPLVLLLHGFPQFWWTWRAQLTSLPAAGYRAVAADLRGYGGSDKPPRGYDLITAASDDAKELTLRIARSGHNHAVAKLGSHEAEVFAQEILAWVNSLV